MRGRSCSLLQRSRINPADVLAVLAMRAALDDGEPVEWVVLNYRKDGSTLWYKVRIWQGGEVRYFVGIQEDYSATHAAHVQLERLAYLDSLTGLGNRRAFEVQLAEHVRRRASVALVLIDLNDFKQVNDRRGHPAGDLLLEQVGRCLERTVGDEGRAFRLGGDEFAGLLPGAEAARGRGSASSAPFRLWRTAPCVSAWARRTFRTRPPTARPSCAWRTGGCTGTGPTPRPSLLLAEEAAQAGGRRAGWCTRPHRTGPD